MIKLEASLIATFLNNAGAAEIFPLAADETNHKIHHHSRQPYAPEIAL